MNVTEPTVAQARPAARRQRRRGELADFLRNRRARITPADVGLPPGLRRRTPGLRREEVAQLAGVGVTWYTWLEQGRPINASVQVLDSIARTLRLDTAEREHLLRLAGVAFPEQAAGSGLPPEIHSICAALEPLAACVYNGRYDLLAWNETYSALFPLVTLAPDGRRNAMWHVFTVPECCNTFTNRDEELPYMVATLRAVFGRHHTEPDWIGFIERLSAASPVFARMWAEHDVVSPGSHVKLFKRTEVGDIAMKSTSLAIDGAPETRLVVYNPTCPESEERLRRLRAIQDPLIGCAAHVRRLSEATAEAGQGTMR